MREQFIFEFIFRIVTFIFVNNEVTRRSARFRKGLSSSTSLSWVTDVTGQDKVTWQDFFSYPLYFFPHSFSSSYFLPLFRCLISTLLFPCASVWENTLAKHHYAQRTNTLVWWHACYTTKLQTNVHELYKTGWQVLELILILKISSGRQFLTYQAATCRQADVNCRLCCWVSIWY